MTVKVHSMGAVDAPTSRVVLRDRAGRIVATASVPPLKAPSDLMPKTADAALDLPANTDWHGGAVTVEMSGADPDKSEMLHPELQARVDADGVYRAGRRLDHAEATSKPLRSQPEKQPHGAKDRGNRPVDQAEAAARFIAAPGCAGGDTGLPEATHG